MPQAPGPPERDLRAVLLAAAVFVVLALGAWLTFDANRSPEVVGHGQTRGATGPGE